MIYKKSAEEVGRMRQGARILNEVFSRMEEALRPGVTTQQLDTIARETMESHGARPSFLGYRGFAGSICASINDEVVHGIPGPRRLEEGDLAALDVGVFHEGFHVDSAWTFPVGEVDDEAKRLLQVTEEALYAALAACRPGGRLGDIGYAIEVTAARAGVGNVTEYGGHGVGRALHEDPHVPNHGPAGRREQLTPGMTLAIEPMFNLGTERTKVLADGWTVVTADGAPSAHFEHTVLITQDGHEILTERPGRPASVPILAGRNAS